MFVQHALRRPAQLRTAVVLATAVAAVACTSASPLPTATPPQTVAPPVTAAPTLTATPESTPFPIKDGEPWIVYSQANGVLLVRPDGPEPHKLMTTYAEHPDWSPDGKLIVVVAEPTADSSEIRVLNADGTNEKTVVACTKAPCVGFAGPAWSHDGKQLAFMRYLQPAAYGYEDDQIAIEVLDLASGASRVVAESPVVAGGKYVEYVGPRWSPDGTQIVFTVMNYPTPPTDENIQSSTIAVVKADGSEIDAPRILTDPALFGMYADWSPDGERIVFSTYPLHGTTKAHNLYTMWPDGTGLTQITHFDENDAGAVEPTWTPDGTRIIFVHIVPVAGDPIGEAKIAFVNADGSNLSVSQWFGTHPRLRPTP